jgi:hypothetical protein
MGNLQVNLGAFGINNIDREEGTQVQTRVLEHVIWSQWVE